MQKFENVIVSSRTLESIQEQTYYDLCQTLAHHSTGNMQECITYFKLAGRLSERGNAEYLRISDNILTYCRDVDFNKALWQELKILSEDLDSLLYSGELLGHLLNDAQDILLFVGNSKYNFSGLVRESVFELRRVMREIRPDPAAKAVMEKYVAFNKLRTDNLESCYIRKEVVAHSTDFGRKPCPRQWSEKAWKEYSEEYSESAQA